MLSFALKINWPTWALGCPCGREHFIFGDTSYGFGIYWNCKEQSEKYVLTVTEISIVVGHI